MPAVNVLARQESNGTAPIPLEPIVESGARGEPPKTWMIAPIVGGLVFVVLAVVFVVFKCLRRRNFNRAKQSDPFLTPREFHRRRKMSAADRLEEAEEQRNIMIRKSLASRSSLLKRNSQSEVSEVSMDDDEFPTSLRDDWKEWEARVYREQGVSTERHPSIYYEGPPVPEPAITRPSSQARIPGMDLTPALQSTSTFGNLLQQENDQVPELPQPAVVPLLARAVSIRHSRGGSIVSAKSQV
jgi:hypothetical protein